MAKNPSLIIRWTKGVPSVKIYNFGLLSPVKIEKCFEATIKEWWRLRAVSLNERRKQEIEERTGAQADG